jgi:hypothetical protein
VASTDKIELIADRDLATMTLTPTADEAAFLTVMLGKNSHNSAEALLVGGGALSTAVYDQLAANFNGFYDDGVNDYLAHHR